VVGIARLPPDCRAGRSGYRRSVISRPHLLLGVALTASSALGASVRSGHLDLGRRRWLHHALYAASLMSAVGASTIDAARGRPTCPVSAGTLAVLAVLPSTRGGSQRHVVVAAVASSVYVIGTVVVIRRQRATVHATTVNR